YRGVRGHALRVVAVRDVDTAVGPDDDVVGLIELPIGVAWLTGDPEAEEHLALRAELVDLVTLRARFVGSKVGDPDVAILVHVDTVRRHHDAFPEVRQYFAGVAIELEHRIDRVVVAIDRTSAGRARAAALVAPNVAVFRIEVETG